MYDFVVCMWNDIKKNSINGSVSVEWESHFVAIISNEWDVFSLVGQNMGSIFSVLIKSLKERSSVYLCADPA